MRQQWVLMGLFALGWACSSDSGGEKNDSGIPPLAKDGSLTLPAPEDGIQIESPTFTIPTGGDSEFCYAVTLKNEAVLNVNTFQSQYREGSHHFILFANFGDPVPGFPDGELYSCGANGEGDINPGDGDMGDFQIAYATQLNAETLKFPDGVALKLPAGTQLVLNSHYINYTDADLTGQVRVNLVGVPDEAVEQEANLYFWFNPIIWIEAGQSYTSYLDCGLPAGTNVVTLNTHTHELGVNFDVYSDIGGKRTLLHNETDWEEPGTVVYDPAYVVSEGEKFHFECSFENPNDHAVMVGTSSKDEMCITFGYYYPKATDRDESCFNEIIRRAVTGEDVPPPLMELVGQFLD